jgi:hypothetical protein
MRRRGVIKSYLSQYIGNSHFFMTQLSPVYIYIRNILSSISFTYFSVTLNIENVQFIIRLINLVSVIGQQRHMQLYARKTNCEAIHNRSKELSLYLYRQTRVRLNWNFTSLPKGGSENPASFWYTYPLLFQLQCSDGREVGIIRHHTSSLLCISGDVDQICIWSRCHYCHMCQQLNVI